MAENLPTLGQVSGERRRPQGGEADAGFFESAFSAGTRELFGLDPSQDVRRYRAENPGGALASQVAGQLPYFTAPFLRPVQAGVRMLPGFGRGIRSGNRLIGEGRTALGEASRDVSSMAAFETARIGGTAALGGDVSEVVGEAAFELALTGAGSALIGHLSRSLPPENRPTSFEQQVQRDLDPEFNLNDPPQIKLRRFSEIRERVEDPGILDEVDRHIVRYASAVRKQNTPERRGAVRRVASMSEDENRRLGKNLSDYFDVQDGKGLFVAKLTPSKQQGGMGGTRRSKNAPSSVDELLQKAGMPEGLEKKTFLPRYAKIKTADQARKTQKTLNEVSSPMNVGGRQTWITRETDNGAYVIFRRANEDFGRIKKGDEFVTFKTDDPSFFGPELGAFNRVIEKNVFEESSARSARVMTGSVTQSYQLLENQFPTVGVMSGELRSGLGKDTMGRQIVESLFGKDRIGRLEHVTRGSKDFAQKIAKEYVSPTLTRYGGPNGSARASSISLAAKAITDRAKMQATQFLSGKFDSSYKTAMWRDIFKPQAPRSGGLLPQVDKLTDEDLSDITRAWRGGMSPEDMANEGMRVTAIDFMKNLRSADSAVIDDFNRMMDDIGFANFEGMENHYMLSHLWEGRIRIPIRKKNGNIVAVASGKTAQQARDEAAVLKSIIDNEGELEVNFNPKEIKYADEGDDLNEITEAFSSRQSKRNINWLRRARTPDRFEKRKGIRGYQHERSDFTHKDLRQMLSKQVNEMYQLAAHRIIDTELDAARKMLYSEDPEFSRMLESELTARMGKRGEWSKRTEDAVDRILTPVFGVRASEIVRATNNAIFQLTLGMGNVGFAALNAVTFMQTTLPEISFLMKAAPETVRKYYGSSIVQTPSGIRPIRTLEPLRFVNQGFKDMANPPDDLWEIYKRAQDEGRVSPVLSEEVFGPNSDIIQHLKGFYKEHRTLPETMQELSAYLPARTEELSRSMALSMGYRMGKDFMQLEGEQLYQFATRFVDNTHFRYTAADRPQLMRGAFGSLIGLFKSWMMHYVGNMTKYGGEAVRRGQFGPLMWSQAGTFGIAGLSGSAILPIAEGMNGLMSDEPLVQNLYEGMGWSDDGTGLGSPADAIYFGLPAFLNLSLSHRASVPGADIPNDIEQLYSVMHWDRAVALGDIFGASADAMFATGEHPARSQETMDAMYRAFLPKTAQAVMKNINQRGTRSLRTQNTILSEQTWSETTINALGFQPNRLGRAYEMMDIMFERQEEKREAITAFGEMMAQAEAANDPAAMQNILMRAQYQGIEFSKIDASSQARQSKRGEGLIERQFDDIVNYDLRKALGGD